MESPATLPENVHLVPLGERKIYVVGTAHLSESSTQLAVDTVRRLKPDTVAIELCDSRYQSLRDPNRWRNTDIVSVIRGGKAYVLLAQLILAAFQKKLGTQLNLRPGAEMLKSMEAAQEVNAGTALIDRDIRTTLKRTWGGLGLGSMARVLTAMAGGLFGGEKIEQADIERLKSADALEALMRDFSKSLPEVRRTLIDERDQYMAAKIKAAPGGTVVAVVGAAHVPGILNWLPRDPQAAPLETIPPASKLKRAVAWGIPLLVVALIALGVWRSGVATGMQMMWAWIGLHSLFAAIGAAVALAHPLTIIAAAITAPFSSLNPIVRVGLVAGIAEALLRKPRVSDLETIADDIVTVRGIYRNRVSKILLVMVLASVGSALATLISLHVIGTLL